MTDEKYADSYSSYRKPSDEYWSSLTEFFPETTGPIKLLDVGCGPGFILDCPEVNTLNLEYCGLDKSKPMLNKAISSHRGRFVQGSADELPFGNNSFNSIIVSNAIHWASMGIGMIENFQSILCSDGRLIICTADRNGLDQEWEYIAFPEALEIDKRRLPKKSDIKKTCKNAELEHISSTQVPYLERKLDWDVLTMAENKAMSSLQMLDQEDFEDGLNRLEQIISNQYGETHTVQLTAHIYEQY